MASEPRLFWIIGKEDLGKENERKMLRRFIFLSNIFLSLTLSLFLFPIFLSEAPNRRLPRAQIADCQKFRLMKIQLVADRRPTRPVRMGTIVGTLEKIAPPGLPG